MHTGANLRSPISPLTMDNKAVLDDCLVGFRKALAAQLDADLGLMDPLIGQATPPDHYGQTATALALKLLRNPCDALWKIPFQARCATPAELLDHAPFNRLVLLLLSRTLDATDPVFELVMKEITRCKLQSHYPSNNWTLLAQVCELLETDPGSVTARRLSERSLLQLDQWLTSGGGFIDYPRHPERAGQLATPVAYHSKALLLTTLASLHTGEPAWAQRMERMLTWTMMCWDGGGHVGGLGRSTHALFGDACLVACLVLMGYADPEEKVNQETVGYRMLRGMLHRWRHQRRSDGFLRLNPAAEDRSGWDSYMHLSVYNAWTAGLLAWARWRRTEMPDPWLPCEILNQTSLPMVMHDSRAGIMRVGTNDGFLVMVSTTGQAPQAFAREEVELRYAGALPFYAAWLGHPICPPPVRLSLESLLKNPALAGWVTVLATDRGIWGLTDWQCELQEQGEDQITLVFTGWPRPLLKHSSSKFGVRLIEALDWRVLGGAWGRRAALRREPMKPIRSTMTLTIDLYRPRITTALKLELDEGVKSVRLLNPCGHALVSNSLPIHRRWHLAGGGRPHLQGQGYESTDWLTGQQDGALADASGYCLPSFELASGQCFTQCLQLDWPRVPVQA